MEGNSQTGERCKSWQERERCAPCTGGPTNKDNPMIPQVTGKGGACVEKIPNPSWSKAGALKGKGARHVAWDRDETQPLAIVERELLLKWAEGHTRKGRTHASRPQNGRGTSSFS